MEYFVAPWLKAARNVMFRGAMAAMRLDSSNVY
jgi:hypothetical protein